MVLADKATGYDETSSIRCDGLVAAYSLGQTTTGDWFAIGSVRSTAVTLHHPAWFIVSTGSSRETTVEALQTQLEIESRRLSTWSPTRASGQSFAAAESDEAISMRTHAAS